MGKYLTALTGLALIALGAWGVRASWPSIVSLLKAVLPLVALVFGVFALLIGLAEIGDSLRHRSDKPSSSTPA